MITAWSLSTHQTWFHAGSLTWKWSVTPRVGIPPVELSGRPRLSPERYSAQGVKTAQLLRESLVLTFAPLPLVPLVMTIFLEREVQPVLCLLYVKKLPSALSITPLTLPADSTSALKLRQRRHGQRLMDACASTQSHASLRKQYNTSSPLYFPSDLNPLPKILCLCNKK